MSDLSQEVRRGEEAHRILTNDIYKESFAMIESRLINELAQIEIKPERAEYVRQLLAMGRKYRAYLEQIMVSGKLAEQQLSLMERVKAKARAIF